jgi:hypothetical protein
MAYYYKIIHQEDFKIEEGQIKQTTFFFLYPHQTHWIYRVADLSKDRVTVEYCRANCRHDEQYLTAWRNSNTHDGPPPDNDDNEDNDSTKNDSEEETTPNNDS